MKQTKVLLGAIIIASSCVGIAPTWSQTSPQTRPGENPVADKQAEQQSDKQKTGEKGKSGQSDLSAKTPQTRPGDNPVADKQAEQSDKQKMSEKGMTGQEGSMRQTSGGSGTVGGRLAQSDVKKIQEALRDKGNDPGAIDGMIGPKTREAIKSFQTTNKLNATGRIDAETSKQLGVDQSQPSSMR